MTSRERLLAVLHRTLPDCVPCCPDISNMVPCRLTGKPFWEVYAYRNPPLWKAHIDALKYFDLDGGFELYDFGGDVFADAPPECNERIVGRFPDGAFATRHFYPESGHWSELATYYASDQPVTWVHPGKLGLPAEPSEWEPLTGVKEWPHGMELWNLVRREMGDQGIVGLWSGASTVAIGSPEDVYAYHDNPEPWRRGVRERMAAMEKRMEQIAAMNPRPDFLMCGGSGTLVFQTPAMFRELALPVVRRATELACDLGIPTHVHSCGPERELVRIAAEETRLTVIDPLEIPPMGDCDLADLKRRFGDKIVLKGNLHTTTVMLQGSVQDVRAASRAAIDAAGAGGGFVLSTGDQCGRDTPDDNIRAMRDTARTYGRY